MFGQLAAYNVSDDMVPTNNPSYVRFDTLSSDTSDLDTLSKPRHPEPTSHTPHIQIRPRLQG